MTPEQIVLVQKSFERAVRLGPHVAATFYTELFAIDPALRPMFKGDMVVQGQKLMSMLGAVIAGLTTPETVLPVARDLAMRHVDYGVEPRHYKMVGTALMRTLRHELGQDFTPDLRDAWANAYKLLSETMIEAAYGQPQAAAV